MIAGSRFDVFRVVDARELAGALTAWLAMGRDDEFATDVVCAGESGVQRWLAQQAAGVLGSHNGDGICAGVEFTTTRQVCRRLLSEASGVALDEDPWDARRLGWTVVEQMDLARGDAWLASLWRHVDASGPGARMATALRIARLFARYADVAPAMLRSWRQGDDVGPRGESLSTHQHGVHVWQPHLWRRCADVLSERTGVDHPAARLDALTPDQLASIAPERVFIAAPGVVSESERQLVAQVALCKPWSVALVDPPGVGTPLGDRLGRLARTADADWKAFAPRPVADPAPSPRQHPTLEVHASHGPDRQVEVLRDVLLRLLSADSTLEPRDILVVCSDVELYAPLLTAAFAPDEAGLNPSHSIRVRTARRADPAGNPVLTALALILAEASGRATRTRVLDILLLPAVASRYGFVGDRAENLVALVDAVEIKWGLDEAHRAQWGVPRQASNTWRSGLDRLIVGVALADDELRTVADVLPYDDVESDAVDLTGALAEAIDHLTLFWRACGHRRSVAAWVEACRDLVHATMSDLPGQPWHMSDALGKLAGLASHSGESPTPLSAAEFRVLLEDTIDGARSRPAFGSGDTLVCAPGDLSGVPHRVVVALGFDADTFPHVDVADGDDLAADLVSVTGRRARDRHHLLDTVARAEERLVLIYRGHDPVSNAEVPPSVPFSEVIDALGSGDVIHHPLQPFSPRNFDRSQGMASFDEAAYHGAAALTSPPLRAPDPFAVDSVGPPQVPQQVSLKELGYFVAHPARRFLRLRAGLYQEQDEWDEEADQLPLQLEGLDSWAVGQRMLDLVLAGHSMEAALRSEQLRGTLPVGSLGDELAARLCTEVSEIAEAARPLRAGSVHDHDISLEIVVPARDARPASSVLLTGAVRTWDDQIVDVGFSSIGPRHRLIAWMRLLALGAQNPGAWRWVGVGKRGRCELGPIPATWNLPGISSLVELYVLGLDTPLPLPVRASEAYARAILDGREPSDVATRRRVERAWEWDVDAAWRGFFPDHEALLRTRPIPADSRLYAEPSRFGTLARRVWEPLLRVENGGG